MSGSDTKLIPLSGGKLFAIVDDEDYEYLRKSKWRAGEPKKGFFYATKIGNIRMHRLIMQAQVGQQVDHINGNTLDNRRSNLRICSNQENARNRYKPVTGLSNYKGVKRSNTVSERWTAQIGLNGKDIHLGSFATQEEAASAYDKAAIEHYGEFAKTNAQTNKMMGLL